MVPSGVRAAPPGPRSVWISAGTVRERLGARGGLRGESIERGYRSRKSERGGLMIVFQSRW